MIKIGRRSISTNSMTFKNGHRVTYIGFGRLSVSLHNHWIGFSRRKVSSLGHVVDIGFVKVVLN